MPNHSDARMKGASIRDFYVWYEGQYGRDRMRTVWEGLPEKARHELGESYSALMPFKWYTVGSVHALLDATLRYHDDEEREHLARQGAQVVISQTLVGLYRAIFKTLVSPSRYLRSTSVVWKAFHDSGRVEAVEVAPRHHRSELFDWRGHHPFLERLNGHAAKAIYEAMGCTSVRFDQSRGTDRSGKPSYVIETRWQGEGKAAS